MIEAFFSFLYSLVLVYKYQNRDHYICNFKCHRQKKYTMAFKANKPHGYQYTENRALTVQNLLCGLRQTLSNLSSTPQDLLPRPCKFSTSGRGSFDIPTSCSSASCSRLWNLSKREICQKSFYFFFNLGMILFYHIFIIWHVTHFGNHIYKLSCMLKFFHIFALVDRKILSRKCHFWQTIKHEFHRIINYFSLNTLKLLPS